MKNFRIKNSKEGFTSTEQQYESFVKKTKSLCTIDLIRPKRLIQLK